VTDFQTPNTLPSGLYVVATPIGELMDLSPRAIDILSRVVRVYAEDTRVTGQLLKHVNIKARLVSLNAHTEVSKTAQVLQGIEAGEAVALVSDAGTPAISDPGRALVAAALKAQLRVVPIPGPSALATALSVSGLPASPSHFIGFLPAKGGARTEGLATALAWPGTLVLYEAPHRIADLADRLDAQAAGRTVVFARELTKTFEQIICVESGQCADWVRTHPDRIRGEFVVMVGPAIDPGVKTDLDVDRLLLILARELPPSKAASLCAEITGLSKRALYQKLTDRS
jgi:16S rRNA (cytidine1402-2'-O)-methyltransferase